MNCWTLALDQVQTLNRAVFPEETPRSDEDTPRTDALRRLTSIGRRDELADERGGRAPEADLGDR